FIDINDDGIADVVLSPACNRRFRALLKCGVESASRRGRVAVGRLSVIRWIISIKPHCSLHRFACFCRYYSTSPTTENEDGEEEEGSFIEQLQKRRHLAVKETNVSRTTFGQERHVFSRSPWR
ncbi:hypothetical protein JG687_00014288, partial [Phytophthora cactorum]